MVKRNTFLSLLLLFSSFFFSCKDEENNNVPLTAVNISIVLDDPDYIKLKNVGGWEYIAGGSRGIIVFHIAQDQFKAYDRHCTFEPSNTCALVSVDPNNITATDACCNSSFLLQDGSVSKPPASTPLKSYRTSYDGVRLTITN